MAETTQATQTETPVQTTSVPGGNGKSRKGKKGGKGRAPGTEYPVADGGIRFADGKFVDPDKWSTPFKHGVHNKLKTDQFADVLDYHRYNVWINRMNLAEAEADCKRVASLGGTPEDRNAMSEDLRLMKLVERRMMERMGAKAGGASGILKLFAETLEKAEAAAATGSTPATTG